VFHLKKLLVFLLIQLAITSSLSIAPEEHVDTYTNVVYLENPSLKNICSFLANLYVDLTSNYGCVRESPIAESNRCYTSTNLLAEYVLRNLCNNTQLADKVKGFLEEYNVDFFSYYQILLGKNFTLPFTVVENIKRDVVHDIEIYHTVRTTIRLYDYDQYADLLVYSALYYVTQRDLSSAVMELIRLNALFDNYGFRDKAYSVLGKYETYKVALAVIAFKTINHTSLAEKYTNILLNIKPLTTLYVPGESTDELVGIGDLNVETACLIAIALYSEIPVRVKPAIQQEDVFPIIADIHILVIILLTLLAITLVLVAATLVLTLKLLKRLVHVSTLILKS